MGDVVTGGWSCSNVLYGGSQVVHLVGNDQVVLCDHIGCYFGRIGGGEPLQSDEEVLW